MEIPILPLSLSNKNKPVYFLIHFSMDFLSTYCVHGSLLGLRGSTGNVQDVVMFLRDITVSLGKARLIVTTR